MNRVELQIQFQNIDAVHPEIPSRDLRYVVPVFMATPHPLEQARSVVRARRARLLPCAEAMI